jgi:hypothetical protein
LTAAARAVRGCVAYIAGMQASLPDLMPHRTTCRNNHTLSTP